jgi:hypothetical protein
VAPQANDKRSGGRSGKAVEGEPIELHGGSVGDGVVGKHGPLLENDGEIVMGMRSVRGLRMNDDGAEEADHFLHGTVSVVEEGAFLVNGEFIGKRAAGRNGFLADPRNAVLLDGDFEAVPVHGSAFREGIFDDDADAVTLRELDGWSGAAAVVAPSIDGFEGRDLALERLGFQVEDFDGAMHLEREIRDVGSDDGDRRFWGRGRRGELLGSVGTGRGRGLCGGLAAPSKQAGDQERAVLKKVSACSAHTILQRFRIDKENVASVKAEGHALSG